MSIFVKNIQNLFVNSLKNTTFSRLKKSIIYNLDLLNFGLQFPEFNSYFLNILESNKTPFILQETIFKNGYNKYFNYNTIRISETEIGDTSYLLNKINSDFLKFYKKVKDIRNSNLSIYQFYNFQYFFSFQSSNFFNSEYEYLLNDLTFGNNYNNEQLTNIDDVTFFDYYFINKIIYSSLVSSLEFYKKELITYFDLNYNNSLTLITDSFASYFSPSKSIEFSKKIGTFTLTNILQLDDVSDLFREKIISQTYVTQTFIPAIIQLFTNNISNYTTPSFFEKLFSDIVNNTSCDLVLENFSKNNYTNFLNAVALQYESDIYQSIKSLFKKTQKSNIVYLQRIVYQFNKEHVSFINSFPIIYYYYIEYLLDFNILLDNNILNSEDIINLYSYIDINNVNKQFIISTIGSYKFSDLINEREYLQKLSFTVSFLEIFKQFFFSEEFKKLISETILLYVKTTSEDFIIFNNVT